MTVDTLQFLPIALRAAYLVLATSALILTVAAALKCLMSMAASVPVPLLAAVLGMGVMVTVAQADDVTLNGDSGLQRRSCIEVEIDGQKASDVNCLNQELEQKAASVPHGTAVAPLSATAPNVQTGGFNQSAIRQQYGQNLGKSAEPYRPSAPVYAPPLGGH